MKKKLNLFLCVYFYVVLVVGLTKALNTKNHCTDILKYRDDKITKNLVINFSVQFSGSESILNDLELEYVINKNEDAKNPQLVFISKTNLFNENILNYKLIFEKYVQTPPTFVKIRLNKNIVCQDNLKQSLSQVTKKLSLRHKITNSIDTYVIHKTSKVLRRKRSQNDNGLNFHFFFGSPLNASSNARNDNFLQNFQNQFSNNLGSNPFFTNKNFLAGASVGNEANFLNRNPFFSSVTTTQKSVTSNAFFNSPFFNNPNSLFPKLPENKPSFSNPMEDLATNQNEFQEECRHDTIQLIAGGQNIENSAFPWLGALYREINDKPNFLCGTTLINNKYALTAAHCVLTTPRIIRKYRLLFGRPYLTNWLADGLLVHIKNVFQHESYNPQTGIGDIAVLQFLNKIAYTDSIKPICLWNGEKDIDLLKDKVGTVVGWGLNERGVLSDYPTEISVPMVSREECVQHDSRFENVTSETNFCAGSRDGFGPCKGDSGSGLQIKIKNKWFLRGVVSTSLPNEKGECDLNNYIIFVDVAKFYDWIASIAT